MDGKQRCAWAVSDPMMRDYHDIESGAPERDSRLLWDPLMLTFYLSEEKFVLR